MTRSNYFKNVKSLQKDFEEGLISQRDYDFWENFYYEQWQIYEGQ